MIAEMGIFFYYTSNTWHASSLQYRHVFLLIKQNKDVMLVIIRETMASRNGTAPGWDALVDLRQSVSESKW